MGADRKAAPFALAGRLRLGKAVSGGGRHEVKASAGAGSGALGRREAVARGDGAGASALARRGFEGAAGGARGKCEVGVRGSGPPRRAVG